MIEKETSQRVQLSSSLTGFIKYFPMVIGILMTMIPIVTGQPESAIIPVVFLVIGLSINLFIVTLSVDKNYIYIKQWIKEIKYPIESLDKVGDFSFAEGWAIIDIKTDTSTTRTFLVIGDLGNLFNPDESKNVSDFLIKLKSAKHNKGQ